MQRPRLTLDYNEVLHAAVRSTTAPIVIQSTYVGFQYQTLLKRVYVICTELKKKYYFEEEKKRVLKSK